MIVPGDLQKVVGKTELRYSLKTVFLSDAKYKARILAGQVQLIFQILRKGLSILFDLLQFDKIYDPQLVQISRSF
jgi:hypothetical protein